MARIFAFPGSRTGKVSSSLQAHANSSSENEGQHRVDWDNYELASLYRVEGLLVQANIRILTGRGVSDEGDPWFVFCRDNGEVFIHLARIDGAYLLDSPGLTDVLRGSDFSELIGCFVRQIGQKTAAAADNVVPFRPRALQDQMIRLHPSVMLAALVWSLYLASDDFNRAAQAMEAVAEKDLDAAQQASDFIGELVARGEELVPELALLQLSQHIGESHEGGAPIVYGGATVLAPGDATRQTGPTTDNRAGSSLPAPFLAQGVAASLALIAVSYGFHDLPELEAGLGADIVVNDDKTVQMASGGAEDTAQFGEQPESDNSRLPDDFTGLSDTVSMPTLSVGDLTIPTPDTSVPAMQPHTSDAAFAEAANELPTEATPLPPPPNKAASQQVKAAVPSVGLGSAAKSEPKNTVAPESSPKETQQVLTLANQYAGTLNDYQIDGLAVATTLDYAGLDKVLIRINSDDITSVATASETTEVASGAEPTASDPAITSPKGNSIPLGDANYDEAAQRFITQFIRSTEQIELVQFNMEIVLIDMTAIDDPTDIAHTRRWVTEDGHVISTIGHLQDFIDYGIA